MKYLVNCSYEPEYFEVGGVHVLAFRAAELEEVQKPASNCQSAPCDHSFVGNDCLCKKCGLYFPETNK